VNTPYDLVRHEDPNVAPWTLWLPREIDSATGHALGRRDSARRARVRRQLGVGDDRELILAVGRREFQKGHVHLVEAVAGLARERSGVVAAIAGRVGNATGDLDRALFEARLTLDRALLRRGSPSTAAPPACTTCTRTWPACRNARDTGGSQPLGVLGSSCRLETSLALILMAFTELVAPT